jgi:hypothetical protein
MKNQDPYLKHRNGMRLRQSTFDRWERIADAREAELKLNPRKPLPNRGIVRSFVNKKRAARSERRRKRLLRGT